VNADDPTDQLIHILEVKEIVLGEVPLSEFTLTHYGLAEPIFAGSKTWWIVLAGLGVGIGFAVWRYRRK
jgi:hypothetical protein